MHRRQLRALVYGVGRRVPVRQHQPALTVKLAPVGLVAGKAVHGVKARRRVGVHVVGLVAERAG